MVPNAEAPGTLQRDARGPHDGCFKGLVATTAARVGRPIGKCGLEEGELGILWEGNPNGEAYARSACFHSKCG